MNKPTPANHGRSWTERENQALGALFDNGTKLGAMAAVHGRTPGAILGQLVRIGKLVNVEGRYYRTDALWYDYREVADEHPV